VSNNSAWLCVDLPNSYQCHCTEGYRGDHCQIGKAVNNHIKQEDSSKYALYLVVNLFLNTVGIVFMYVHESEFEKLLKDYF
jgi:hypothetical protein